MAFSIERSTVPLEIAQSIRKMLCLQPETTGNKYNQYNTPEPILFYVLRDGILHLPYLFAASILQIIPNINIPYPVTELSFSGSLRDKQIAVEEEAWSQLERFGTSTLGLYPGFGKTILGAKLASRAKLMTVILVHREILTTQWKKTFTDVTNAKVWIVGEKKPPPICDVIICMDTRWSSIPKEIIDAVGFLIIDEAHAFCTRARVQCLLAFHPKYIVIESASLERDDGLHSMIYAIAGQHGVFRESNIPFSVMKITTNTKPPRTLNKMGGIDWAALVQDTLMNPRRNEIILNLVRANLKHKILILTSLRCHATLLYDKLQELNIPSDYLCGSKKGYVDSSVLVGTISKIGTGFDPATSCPTYAGKPFDLLILVCSIKKYSMLVQNIGRVFRADLPIVMHLVDSDDILKSHWYIARKWYLARGANITNHNVENKDESDTESLRQQDIVAQHDSWIKDKIEELKRNSVMTLNVIAPTPISTSTPTPNIMTLNVVPIPEKVATPGPSTIQNGLILSGTTQNGLILSGTTQNGLILSGGMPQNGSILSGTTQNGSGLSGTTQNGSGLSGGTTQNGSILSGTTQNGSGLSGGTIQNVPIKHTVVMKQNVTTAPSVPMRQNVATAPSVPMRQNVTTAPSVPMRQNVATAPSVSMRQNVATAPSVSMRQNVATAPSVSMRQNVATAPSVPMRQNVATAPSVSMRQNGATTQSVPMRQNVATAPSVPMRQNVATAPSVPMRQNVATTQSVPMKQNVATTQSVPMKQNVVTTQSVPMRQNVVTAQSVSMRQNVVTAQSVPMRQNGATTQSVPMRQNGATTQSVPMRQNVVTTQSVPMRQNVVTAQSVPMRQNVATGQGVTMRQNVVTAQSVPMRQNNVATGQSVPMRQSVGATQGLAVRQEIKPIMNSNSVQKSQIVVNR